jgi:para-aminobenzoate synthetase component 1
VTHSPIPLSIQTEAEDSGLEPLVEELSPSTSAVDVFRRLSALPHCVFFDSALRHNELGRYSFIAADPFDYVEMPADGSDALAKLTSKLELYQAATVDGLPPFQGGAAGLLGYELAHSLERAGRARHDEFEMPALAIGFYDVVVAFDHVQQQAWLISHGFPEFELKDRTRRAVERLAYFRKLITASDPPKITTHDDSAHIESDQLARQFPTTGLAGTKGLTGLTSDFSRDDYLRAAEQAIEYIHAGDVFQVNLSQRLLHAADDSSLALYLRLRDRNPATFSAYFDLGHSQILSTSPERLVQLCDGNVEARPIKGTRERTHRPEADLFVADQLRQSAKDRAENIMIADLLRNDLSRVCDDESVHVSDLCQLETYEYVQHLVSVVRGRLSNGLDAVDLLRATFPGGSITGAPKVRAIQIIAELEPTARGAYCGSLAYVGFDGSMDASILIRTITASRGWWQLPVGGGIVAESDPVAEYEETWHKAEGLLRAFEQ